MRLRDCITSCLRTCHQAATILLHPVAMIMLMNRFFSCHSDVVCCVGLILASTASAACRAERPLPQHVQARPITGSLTVSCEPDDDALGCHAIGRPADGRDDPKAETDLTDAVVWSTSNAQAVSVLKGRVTAHHLGVATIIASLRSGNETLSSSAVIVVDEEGGRPKVAYDLKGVVRDLANTGITDVQVELKPVVDHQRAAPRRASTVIDGAFQFSPILGGQYRLIATKGGYRPVERRLKVPDAQPLTLVLISEPR